jgi:hypothetical protein
MRNPGIYFDISNADYHAGTWAIGNSGLQLVADCPALYHGHYLDPQRPSRDDKESAAQRFGNIAHCALFEFPAYNHRYVVGPDVNKNTNAWKDFVKGLAPGCMPCDESERAAGLMIRQQALADKELREALEHPGGRGETSAYWRDERTGVLCKCRPDWFMPVGDKACVLFDAKSFATGSAAEFARQAARMGYDFQAAWYTDGFARATGWNVLAFIHIVISNQWPHPINAVQLGERSIASGRIKYRRALDTYAECLRTGIWPGYAPGIKLVEMPNYALEEV